jgi:diadenylate cyclase
LGDTFDNNSTQEAVTEICKAVNYLSKNKMGSIIVIEHRARLNDIIQTGVTLEAQISSELLVNLFSSNTPLHDGAVVIRNKQIMAASCLLPLTQNLKLSTELGTRHRAALGNSETSDSFTIVTSEETGTISVARGGALTRNLTIASLERALMKLASDNEEAEEKKKKDKKKNKKGAAQ